ncbi:MAG: hypothetical protein KIT31_39995 [Deltaproteobacteria bacterium]|nr:hypothetical protein [Deltaproteobacteria bacterium]
MAEVTVYDGARTARNAWIAAAVGVAVLILGLFVDAERAWFAYLTAFTIAFTIACGGLILLMIGYAANAKWMAVVRRPNEIVALPLPALAVLFIPILFGLGWLYWWHTPPASLSHHEHEVLEHREGYLNTLAFTIRAVIYFAILLVAQNRLRLWSLVRERTVLDTREPVEALSRERIFASAMLPPVGLAFSFAVIDWVMTLQPWYSTMFPVYVFAGGFIAAIALVTVLTARLYHASSPGVTTNHFHALGRMMFAFTVFWAYTAYFQAFLIKIADKPDEVTFYLNRTTGGWDPFVWILVLGHFALPFLFLLPKGVKFRPHAMEFAAWWLIVMHVVDVYWIVMPARRLLPLHWIDLGALLAVGGVCVASAARRQHDESLVASRDPFFAAGAAYRSPL